MDNSGGAADSWDETEQPGGSAASQLPADRHHRLIVCEQGRVQTSVCEQGRVQTAVREQGRVQTSVREQGCVQTR